MYPSKQLTAAANMATAVFRLLIIPDQFSPRQPGQYSLPVFTDECTV
jgi:hypothetical protein